MVTRLAVAIRSRKSEQAAEKVAVTVVLEGQLRSPANGVGFSCRPRRSYSNAAKPTRAARDARPYMIDLGERLDVNRPVSCKPSLPSQLAL